MSFLHWACDVYFNCSPWGRRGWRCERDRCRSTRKQPPVSSKLATGWAPPPPMPQTPAVSAGAAAVAAPGKLCWPHQPRQGGQFWMGRKQFSVAWWLDLFLQLNVWMGNSLQVTQTQRSHRYSLWAKPTETLVFWNYGWSAPSGPSLRVMCSLGAC